jgi:hypothetical protein
MDGYAVVYAVSLAFSGSNARRATAKDKQSNNSRGFAFRSCHSLFSFNSVLLDENKLLRNCPLQQRELSCFVVINLTERHCFLIRVHELRLLPLTKPSFRRCCDLQRFFLTLCFLYFFDLGFHNLKRHKKGKGHSRSSQQKERQLRRHKRVEKTRYNLENALN